MPDKKTKPLVVNDEAKKEAQKESQDTKLDGIINVQRAEETMILAKSMIRHKEQEADDQRMKEIQAIIATCEKLKSKGV